MWSDRVLLFPSLIFIGLGCCVKSFRFFLGQKMAAGRFHIAIEGNVGAGKSTLLQGLDTILKSKGKSVVMLPEPVYEWISFGSQKVNYLRKMYLNPEAFGMKFQVVATLTKIEQLTLNCPGSEILLVERSLAAQKHVFLSALTEAKHISLEDGEILDRLLEAVCQIDFAIPDLTIYLRTSPEVALGRVKTRARPEEEGLTLTDICRLHRLHELWLFQSPRVLVVDADRLENIRPQTIFEDLLKKGKIHI